MPKPQAWVKYESIIDMSFKTKLYYCDYILELFLLFSLYLLMLQCLFVKKCILLETCCFWNRCVMEVVSFA